MMIAAIVKIAGAHAFTKSANGASNDANATDTGSAMKAAKMPPEIILRSAMWGTPKARKIVQFSNMGTAMVSPGIPISAVGMAWVMCLETAAAMNQANIATGGNPSSMINRVRGAMVEVSSVPEIKPTPEKMMPPANAAPIPHSKSFMSIASIIKNLPSR